MAKPRPHIDLGGHGLDWRQRVRASTHFVALVTRAGRHDARLQRQLAYARELGKPIVLLVQHGTALPAQVRGEARVYYWQTTEDLATLVREIVEGAR